MRECKTPGFCNCMSSLIAKQRLRDVIKQDRAAVPCGRWVAKYPDWEQWKHLPHPVPKLHYRYEVRR